MKKVKFTLYVNGRSETSKRAILNVEEICRSMPEDTREFEVIDVQEQPERASNRKILATPTLVREGPPPSRRIVGDLSSRDRVLQGLGLRARTGGTS